MMVKDKKTECDSTDCPDLALVPTSHCCHADHSAGVSLIPCREELTSCISSTGRLIWFGQRLPYPRLRFTDSQTTIPITGVTQGYGPGSTVGMLNSIGVVLRGATQLFRVAK